MNNHSKKEIKMLRYSKLCPCIIGLLTEELKAGNHVGMFDDHCDWPEKGSVFIALTNNLRTNIKQLQHNKNLAFSICTDPHYGWHNECFCIVHRHLLVAGSTKPASKKQ